MPAGHEDGVHEINVIIIPQRPLLDDFDVQEASKSKYMPPQHSRAPSCCAIHKPVAMKLTASYMTNISTPLQHLLERRLESATPYRGLAHIHLPSNSKTNGKLDFPVILYILSVWKASL